MKEKFTEIIKSDELQGISIDLIEKVIDNEITDEVLREVPILKSLLAVRNAYNSYTDTIFIKKAMNVLLELEETNWKQRVELVSDLEDRYETGAEKILMAIDKLETIEKCKVYGRLCKLKALGKIKFTETFLRLTKLIQDAYLADLILVTEFKKGEKAKIHEADYYQIINLGLIYQEPSEQTPIEKKPQHSEYDYEFQGGEIDFNYLLSDLGIDLLEIYYELFPLDEDQR